MMLLPRGKSVKEGVNPNGMDWIEVLGKLHDGHFTGYLNLVVTSGSGMLLFLRGQLTAARFFCGGAEQAGEKALVNIFSASLSRQARLDIYRLEPGLAVELYNLIAGTFWYEGQYRELLDIPYLIDLLKREKFGGGLRIQAGDEVALILMRNGEFLGFFHDGQPGVTTEAALSCSVAWQPGARIDVIRSAGVPETDQSDLLGQIDLITLWDKALLEASQIG
jgi:hypothetical protein